mmetsp:Transcript_98443/g.317372  ORF Transcript_98443/g.317372 Transcript_98443/m.317372 type:complete len:205 (+) Transcript_98443:79-693(+)
MAEVKNQDGSGDGEAKPKQQGYTYWKRDIDDAHVLPDNKPQRIDEQTAAQQAGTLEKKSSSVGSSWNVAGTWEEKDMSAVSREALEQILSNDFLLLEGEGTRICACKASITGDAQAYHIRGRPRLGFEFKGKISWKGTFEGEEVSGDLELQELDSSDLDGLELREKKSSSASEASKRASASLVKGARPAVKRACEELSKRMLER